MPETELLLTSDYDDLCNRHKSLRVKLVRKRFGAILKKEQLPELINIYKTWRDTVEVLPIALTYKIVTYKDFKNTPVDVDKWIDDFNSRTSRFACRFNDNPKNEMVCFEDYEIERILKKCCKRGNDVYIRQINEKFKPLLNSNKHINFFSIEINDKRKRIRKTRLLYITGTCDQKITGNLSESWITFGAYWNSFITNIREMFNGVEYIRTWQSQKNGFPHFHALVYFKDFEFTAVKWIEKNGSISWRVHNRQMLNRVPVRDKIKNAWKWGNLDIKCCNDSKKALKDLIKYVTRDLEGGESDLTNTMVWYYGKQSYSISGGFMALFDVEKTSLEPSDDESINAEGVIQSSNDSKKTLVKIEVFPVLKWSTLYDLVKNTLDKCEIDDKPPPQIIEYLKFFEYSCKPVKSTKKEFNGFLVDVISYDYKEGVEF